VTLQAGDGPGGSSRQAGEVVTFVSGHVAPVEGVAHVVLALVERPARDVEEPGEVGV
jgi:hypothetical protein